VGVDPFLGTGVGSALYKYCAAAGQEKERNSTGSEGIT
jgi:hypothetical protein